MIQVQRPSIKEMLKIKSVAIVGVSVKLGYYWAHSMLQWDHDLNIWLVSHRGGEVLGKKIYENVGELPENIDYAIIAVPQRFVEPVVKQCYAKGAKGVTIFTSGYSELGTDKGRQYEASLRELVHSIPMRVLGPNCMGLTYPKLGFAFMPTAKRLAGNAGFLSQSGGVAIAVYTAGVESGVGFSKLFSFGNQIDITSHEILDYFIDDDETKVVGAYLEGTKDGRTLFQNLRELAKKKPVVILKGGRSAEGSRAASSHTGALAGSKQIWDSAFIQSNVPTVRTLEEMVSTMSVFSVCPAPKSKNVGLVAISGGTSVIYTDLCIEAGLKVPKTSEDTIKKLDPLIRDVGTGLGNPIDLAADYYQDQTISEVIRIVGDEENFDSIIFEADVHNIFQVSSIMDAADVVNHFWEAIAQSGKMIIEKKKKPFLAAIPDVAYPDARKEAWDIFVKYDIPVFRNISEAVTALNHVSSYYEKRRRDNF